MSDSNLNSRRKFQRSKFRFSDSPVDFLEDRILLSATTVSAEVGPAVAGKTVHHTKQLAATIPSFAGGWDIVARPDFLTITQVGKKAEIEFGSVTYALQELNYTANVKKNGSLKFKGKVAFADPLKFRVSLQLTSPTHFDGTWTIQGIDPIVFNGNKVI